MGDESESVVATVPVEPPAEILVAEVSVSPEAAPEVVAEVSVSPEAAPVLETATTVAEIAPLLDFMHEMSEAPKTIASDTEVQEILESIAPGAYFRTRCSTGVVVDTFAVGGVFAPGQQRWVQTNVFDSAQSQAEAIRAALS